jgi:hypothetical protein
MPLIAINETIPVFAQLGNGATNKFVRANVYNPDGSLVVGSPFALSHVSNGLYLNTSLQMPNVTFITVQAESFDDSGYTTPSDSYIEAQVFTLTLAQSGGTTVNTPIPAVAQYGDGTEGLFPVANFFLPDGSLLASSPMNLVEVDNGLYQVLGPLMPDVPFVIIQTIPYTDSGHTVLAAELLGSDVVINLSHNQQPLPMCPDPTISVQGFKSWFYRDFPYGTLNSQVMDIDISKAITQATCFVNQDLFCTTGSYNEGVLLYAAHCLVLNLRASSQGIAGQAGWLQTSKGVGSVSEGFTIPQRILDNPDFALLNTTFYGQQFFMKVYPTMCGAIFTVRSRTNP